MNHHYSSYINLFGGETRRQSILTINQKQNMNLHLIPTELLA
jgi:hypothetical protein